MRKNWFAACLAVVLALLFVNQAAAQRPGNDGPAAIRLQAGTFVPGHSERPDLPPGLEIARYTAGVSGYYIVQFDGAAGDAARIALSDAGADVLNYVPDNAFKVRMTPATARAVEGLVGVGWVGIFHPAYKLSARLTRDGTRLYRLRVENGADFDTAADAVLDSGAEIIREGGNGILVLADAAILDELARVLDVAWVEDFQFHERFNEYAGGVIMRGDSALTSGYDGSTQTVAVADTGLGDGTKSGAHADIPASRIAEIFDWPSANNSRCWSARTDGARDVDSGHGSHTAVSAVGDGGPGGEGQGTAPAADLVMQTVEDFLDFKGLCALSYPDGYYLNGIPLDLHELYQEAYDAGARVHSNSWGSAVAGAYTADSVNTDDFVWNNPDILITYSAGNEGIDGNSDALVDHDSIGSPATAKNVLTVGASENDRGGDYGCDNGIATCGGQNDLGTYGESWPSDFPAGALASDAIAGNQEQMAAFSSRGPTDDGRIKPDVVAPGTWVLSGYSSEYQEFYGGSTNPRNGLYQWDGWGLPRNANYKYMGGTSMANPLAAGAAAVVRDFYQKTDTVNASAALVKATLINSAVDLLDENNDGANDNDFPIPNMHEGWGLIDLAAATDGGHLYVDNAVGVDNSACAIHDFAVTTGSSPFKATLVWTDRPSTEAALSNLVNDLDLTVTGGGATYQGNNFSGGWTPAGSADADQVNNVENVYVQSAGTGTWSVQVCANSIPQGPQPFALVVDGHVAPTGSDTPPSVSIASPTDGATISGDSLNLTASASDDGAVVSVVFFVDDVSIGIDNTDDGWTAVWDLDGIADGVHTIHAVATDDALTPQQTVSAAITVTVDNEDSPPTVSMSAPGDGAAVTGQTTLVADASDDGAVTRVEFYVGGAKVGEDTDATGGWTHDWDSAGVSDGPILVHAAATDDGGIPQTTLSASISVTADNSAPTVTVLALPGSVSGDQDVSALAADGNGSGVSQVEFFADGASIGVDGSGGDGWSITWDTTGVANGLYAITSTATDGVGLTGDDASDVVVEVDNVAATSVSVTGIDYGRHGGKNSDKHLTTTVRVADNLGDPVEGATVSITIVHGNREASGSGATLANGDAVFTWHNAPGMGDPGVCFVTTVTAVSVAGLPWDNVTPPNELCD